MAGGSVGTVRLAAARLVIFCAHAPDARLVIFFQKSLTISGSFAENDLHPMSNVRSDVQGILWVFAPVSVSELARHY